MSKNDIRRGRACVRLIEAADVLLESAATAHERVVLASAREHAQGILRTLIETVDSASAAQILVASDKMLGTVSDIGKN